MRTIVVVLDNIRSVHNVGSIFRTADGAGVSSIFLCGITPEPIDRFGRARADFKKVSLGAEHTVPWEHVDVTSECIKDLQKEGFQVVAIEQTIDSKYFSKSGLHDKVAFVFGSERGGISKEVLRLVDVVYELPMKGEKDSLNVSVAAGIVLYGA